MGNTSRCDELAANGIRRLVRDYGWLSVLRGIALVRPEPIGAVYTPEYVMQVYQTWLRSERPDSRAGKNGIKEDES